MLQQYAFTFNVGNISWGWVPAIAGSPVLRKPPAEGGGGAVEVVRVPPGQLVS